MIPADWRPHHRADGELVGYLAPTAGDAVVAMTLLGTPAGDPTDEWSAQEQLEELGLAYLADRWWLVAADGSQQQVVLVEVSPAGIVAVPAEFAQVVGAPRDRNDDIHIDVPTDLLRPV